MFAGEDIGVFDALFSRESETNSDSEVENIVIKVDKYERKNTDSTLSCLNLSLVSKHHSLWAEYVYNAARILADQIDNGDIIVKDKKCLELGAGAGLPGLICALNGARTSVISDYGHDDDLSLIYAIDMNIKSISQYVPFDTLANMFGVGYIWGSPVNILLNPKDCYQKCPTTEINTTDFSAYKTSKLNARILDSSHAIKDDSAELFDIIFMADLLFNRSEHRKLLWTIKHCLKRTGICYITFSHHDPQKRLLDLNFFTLAVEPEYGFEVAFIRQESRPSYPFVEADGMDEMRGIVYMYTLTF